MKQKRHTTEEIIPILRAVAMGWGTDVATSLIGLLTGACSMMLGIAILLRDRRAFLLGTVVTLNPILWVINAVYISRRHQEFSEDSARERLVVPKKAWRFFLARTAEVSRAVQRQG